MTDINIHEGDFYRHFKGQIYQIRTIATNSEDESLMVVYQAMYPPFKVWVRPLSMFTEKLDTSKYPDAGQTFRFEKINFDDSPDIDINTYNKNKTETIKSADNDIKNTTTFLHNSENDIKISSPNVVSNTDAPQVSEDDFISDDISISDEEMTDILLSGQVERKLTDRLSDKQIAAKGFMIFLDADSYHDKRLIFLSLRQYLNDTMLNNIAVTLDLVLDEGSPEQHFDTILNCLETHEHYECNRLR
ncbi:DUF1653 domain-containing protein [Butyribacter intestini]|uniref:DUF1653 domain-containing protein n=1 Tax=Butyribacter intestini TaxID=1703332 RepID=UPI003AB64083